MHSNFTVTQSDQRIWQHSARLLLLMFSSSQFAFSAYGQSVTEGPVTEQKKGSSWQRPWGMTQRELSSWDGSQSLDLDSNEWMLGSWVYTTGFLPLPNLRHSEQTWVLCTTNGMIGLHLWLSAIGIQCVWCKMCKKKTQSTPLLLAGLRRSGSVMILHNQPDH